MQTALRENAVGVEFITFPNNSAGASGPFPTSVPTPGSLHSAPSMPRAKSSPSFGEGATIAAVSVAAPSKLAPGAETFASVQAVARSAHEPRPAAGSKAKSLALGALGFGAVLGVGGMIWFVRTPSRPEPGVTLPTTATLPPPTARAVPAPEPARPPATATKAVPAPASAPTRVAVNVVKHPPAGKSPPPPPLLSLPLALPPLVKPHSNPPEQRENLFDNRH
jgi:hypothetical protein